MAKYAAHRRAWSRNAALILTLALLATRAFGQTPSPASAAPAPAPSDSPPLKTSINPFDPSNQAKPDLSNLSLEALMSIEVTSATKQKQRVSDVAAAISVLTQEDISRSGYQTIGELLRLVPGVYVGQIDPLRFAVGVRGGANILSNNLLVMMDGRSVYSPADAGVFYEAMDYIMPDIERIEVVRGPGATLWGANAVNGVINVVTKSAQDTQGFLFDSHAGSDGYVNSFRYGGHVGDGLYFRVYGINRAMDDFQQASGKTANDGMDQNRAGFRIDAALSGRDALTVTGEMFQQRAGNTVVKPIPIPTLPFTRPAQGDFNSYGSNLMARWTHTFSETSDFTVQGYFWNLTDISGNLIHNLKDIQSSYDIDFQHRFALMGNQEVIWGGDYRFSTVEFSNIPHAFTAPAAPTPKSAASSSRTTSR